MMTERAVLEVPTLRIDALVQPLVLGAVVLNLLSVFDDLPLPVIVGLGAQGATGSRWRSAATVPHAPG